MRLKLVRLSWGPMNVVKALPVTTSLGRAERSRKLTACRVCWRFLRTNKWSLSGDDLKKGEAPSLERIYMDTSLSKALIMVAGVLLAMIVIAFVTFSFRKMGTWATASDDQLLTEQKDKFNKEYEVYDKSLMYGVDVISCLNKVLSNNEKITNGKVVNGEKYDESYEVKVKVKLKDDPLEESITVYYMNDNKELAYQNRGPDGVKLSDVKFSFIENDTLYLKDISNFGRDDSLETKVVNCKKLATEFNLTKDKNAEGEEELRALLSVSNALSEVKKNPDKLSSSKSDSWTKAEFKSALYDLKTRKFKCTSLTYSEAGRINYIEFKEI